MMRDESGLNNANREICPADCQSVVKQFYRAVFEEREPRRMFELLAADFEFRSCDGIEAGRSEFIEYMKILLDAFPDLGLFVRFLISAHDALAVRWLCAGKNRGWAAGVAPSGRSISYDGVALFRVVQGRIRELDCFADAWHAVRRMSLPPAGSSARMAKPHDGVRREAEATDSTTGIVRRFVKEILEEGDLDGLASLAAESFVFISPQFAPARIHEMRILLSEWYETFLSRIVKVESILADSAHAIAVVHARGRYTGSFTGLGWDPRGSRMDFRAALVVYCENKRIRALEAFYDPDRMWRAGIAAGE